MKNQLKKRFGKATKENLLDKQMQLKQELKSETEKVRRRKTLDERKRINYRFSKNPKSIYREFRKTSSIKVSEPPTKEEMTQFWKGIWRTEITHNINAEWLKHCQDEYCKNAKATKFEINKAIFDSVIKKLSNNKTPGLDLIVGYWIKYMTAVYLYLMNLYVRVACKEIDLPAWLIQTGTNMLA